MRNGKSLSLLLLLIVGIMTIVTGCGSVQDKEFFDDVEQEIHTQIESTASAAKENEYLQEEQKMNFSISNLPEYWFNFGIYVKRWAAVIIVASLAGGWIVFDIFKKNKEVQKWAFDLMIIRIPIFTFLIVYVYAFLYRMLNL